jgi:2-oxoisovalerate dehydrogenase E1 component
MGQDIAEYGGAFKITDGFVAQFGKERHQYAIWKVQWFLAGMGLSITKVIVKCSLLICFHI